MESATHSKSNMIACHICDLLQHKEEIPVGATANCARCATVLYHRKPNAVNRTLAMSLAALFLLIPANIYPIMTIDKLGKTNEATIWSSVVQMFEEGQWEIGAVVFFASLFVPFAKLFGLIFLCISVKSNRFQQARTDIYKLLESIGRWSMVDVFLIAILVAIVKLGDVADVSPEIGSLLFAGAVVLTIMASSSFDARMIWDEEVD